MTDQPDIRVLGDATAEEVAAVVAVLAAATGGSEDAPEPGGSAWASHAAVLRTPVPRGPGAWRTPLRP